MPIYTTKKGDVAIDVQHREKKLKTGESSCVFRIEVDSIIQGCSITLGESFSIEGVFYLMLGTSIPNEGIRRQLLIYWRESKKYILTTSISSERKDELLNAAESTVKELALKLVVEKPLDNS